MKRTFLLFALAAVMPMMFSSCVLNEGTSSGKDIWAMTRMSEKHISNPLDATVEALSKYVDVMDEEGFCESFVLTVCDTRVSAEVKRLGDGRWNVKCEGGGLSFTVDGIQRSEANLVDGTALYQWKIDGYSYHCKEDDTYSVSVNSCEPVEYKWGASYRWSTFRFDLLMNGTFDMVFIVNGNAEDKVKAIYKTGEANVVML